METQEERISDNDVLFSVYSWIIVVAFQVLVHYWFSSRRYSADARNDTVSLSEPVDTCLVESNKSDGDDQSHASARSHREEVIQSLSSQTQNCSMSSFDGNEPEIFFELLSQTGSEMTRRYSHQSIVQEQLLVGG